jgi:arylsulfatase
LFGLLLTWLECLSADQAITQKENKKPPNLIIIMADDLGFSDITPYGGEVSTPSLQQLANDGVKFSRFYTSLTCSPSRAMLLTGADNHKVGLGNMAETIADNQIGLPGYETYLNFSTTTLPAELKKRGYNTFMAGKWHLGLEREHSPAARGFDHSFALLFGAASHYQNGFGPDISREKALYRENGQLVEDLPDGFFSSDFYTNRIIENIKADHGSDKPFFAYLAFTAPHWPLQFPPDYQGQYKDIYAQGWQSIRNQRVTRLKELGLLPKDIDYVNLSSDLPNWQSLTESERKLAAKDMEIYAAMVENMDLNIGRLISFLKHSGMYENTAILFLSDNGADSWGAKKVPKAIKSFADTFDNSLDNRGQTNSFVLYGQHWAEVSSTPFRGFKGNTTDGGIRVPAILKLPNNQTGLYQQSVGIEDIKSLMLRLSVQPDIDLKKALSSNREVNYLARELWGKAGLVNGSWKLVRLPTPAGTGQWQLFNTVNDPGELNDLAKKQSKKLSEMLMLWQQYIDENKIVLPQGEFKIRAAGLLPKQ